MLLSVGEPAAGSEPATGNEAATGGESTTAEVQNIDIVPVQEREFVAMYGTAKKKRPCYLVGNLVATNWPIEKALHAIGYNQIPTK